MMKSSADQYRIELTFFSIEDHFAVIETVRVRKNCIIMPEMLYIIFWKSYYTKGNTNLEKYDFPYPVNNKDMRYTYLHITTYDIIR